MFIATNRFKIQPGREKEFEEVWRKRDTFLDGVPGFERFQLLRGPTSESETLYISHSTWESREAFEDWTRSEAFRKAHGGAGGSKGLVLGHPQFEGFEKVL
ncbi:MAG: antibiotic biosynthesis monooxygenase [Myxococcota bacterium]|nr:antibiotic biosynthesis monooxygenase [Myxococcota bacterium]